ncbi:MAG: molybdopterin dinucleotide binding domain-containing protein [Candidatus Latescibacterota bacterium]|nr:molybdopterin dinucleotide binding domain-containing protein [Candidatus Latescibacterota bacterium]
MHQGEFKNGRGIFKVVGYRDPAETTCESFPIWLTTGRRLQAYHTRTQTGRAQGLEYLLDEERLEVHPADVESLGLTDGDWCRIFSARGQVDVRVKKTTRSPQGTVFASFSFNDVPINILTGSGYDPITDTAELKVCPVRIEAITECSP